MFLFSDYPVQRRSRCFSIIVTSTDPHLAEEDARLPVNPVDSRKSLSFPGVTQTFRVSAMNLDWSFEAFSL